MSFTRIDDLDPDPDLYDALSGRDSELLCRLFNEFRDPNEWRQYEPGAISTDQWKRLLASEFPDETNSFLEVHKRIQEENVRIQPVIEHLAENFDLDEESLQINTRYELVALLVEEELLSELDELIIAAKFRPSAVTGSYTYPSEFDLSNLNERIEEFHTKFANAIEADNKSAKRLDIEYRTERSVAIRYYRESSSAKARYFDSAEDNDTNKPEIEEFHYRKLKNIRFLIVSREGQSRIIFTKNLGGWNRALDTVFYELFDVDNIVEKLEGSTSSVAEDVKDTATASVEADEDALDQIQSFIDDRSQVAKDEVDDLNVPGEQKEELKDLLDSVQITGTEVDEDQSISTREFRIVSQSSLSDLFASVDIEDGFKDFLQKADNEKLGFVLDVDSVPVACKNGRWDRAGPGGLPDDVRLAMQVFFDEDTPI